MLLHHPAFKPAYRLTIGLGAFGFILLEVVTHIGSRADEGGSVLTSVVQFFSAIGLAALLLTVVLVLNGKPLRLRVAGTATSSAAARATMC